jgi:hypothetical protein
VWGSKLIGGPPSEATQAPVDDGGPVLDTGVPSPVDGVVTVSPEGTEYSFTWSNPDPKDGDQYVWQQVGEDGRHPTDQPAAVITDELGTNVCVQVTILRENGAESPAPLKVCVR